MLKIYGAECTESNKCNNANFHQNDFTFRTFFMKIFTFLDSDSLVHGF